MSYSIYYWPLTVDENINHAFGLHQDMPYNSFAATVLFSCWSRLGQIWTVVLSAFHLHDTSEEGHGRSHQHSLFVSSEAFKACDVGCRTFVWDQPGDHRADHQTQDWERTFRERERENSSFVEPGQGHKRTHSQHTAHTGLTHWDVPRGAQEKVNDDGEEGGEESVPGWQRGQQTVGQTWKHKTAHVSCRFTVWCSRFLPFTSRMKHNYLLHFSKHTVKNTKDPLFKISLKHMMFDDHFDVGWRMWKDVYT